MGASFTTSNLGVWALASGVITSALHDYPNARVYFLDYNSQPAIYKVRHPQGTSLAELVNIRFSKKLWLPNHIARLLLTALLIKMIPFRSIRDRIVSRNFWLRHVQTADIVVSIAGGDSFSDIYGIGRLIYVTLPLILVLLLGKSLVLLPQTVGPFKSLFSKYIATCILKHSSIVYSRDHESLETARGILGEDCAKLNFCFDMGFVLEPHIEKERIPRFLISRERNAPFVGLNVSGLLYMGGYTRSNMFGLKADYRMLIRKLLEYFIERHNAHVLLVPHVFGKGSETESDLAACRKIYDDADDKSSKNIHIVEEEYDQHEIKAIIGRCDFFLGSRMHACIAALSQCVPAVGLAYSRKFHGVFRTVGAEDLVIDLRENDVDSVIAAVDRAYQRRDDLRGQLETSMPAVRSSVLGLFSRISLELGQEGEGDVIRVNVDRQTEGRVSRTGR